MTYEISQSASLNRFLYDIVANHHNSIDVDKFDYLKRDSMLCDIKVGFDANRAMSFSKVCLTLQIRHYVQKLSLTSCAFKTFEF
jgi:hypothetical protein